jgi:hypothetical protein
MGQRRGGANRNLPATERLLIRSMTPVRSEARGNDPKIFFSTMFTDKLACPVMPNQRDRKSLARNQANNFISVMLRR